MSRNFFQDGLYKFYMGKSKGNERNKHTMRFLNWVKNYNGFWYLICTPNNGHINPDIMKKLIEQLAEERLYEIIFVLLMVHRNEEYVKSAFHPIIVEMLMNEWDTGHKDDFIKNLLDHFE